jgi:hypothetical protein
MANLHGIIGGLEYNANLRALLADATNQAEFVNVGAKTSETLRAEFYRQCEANHLEGRVIPAIYLQATLCKNRTRLQNHWPQFNDNIRNDADMLAAHNYIEQHMCDTTRQETRQRFALIHLPATNPGLCAMFWRDVRPVANRSLAEFLATPYATQLRLDNTMLGYNLRRLANFWHTNIRRTNNAQNQLLFDQQMATGSSFNQRIWNTQARDRYCLIDAAANGALVEVEPAGGPGTNGNYTRQELCTWLGLNLQDMPQNPQLVAGLANLVEVNPANWI